MHIELPENVKYIIDELTSAGYEAYAVGGCVRDSVLGRKPKDWDITTSAEPLEVKKLFKRTIDTGIKHGTVTVMLKDEGYEVTTYRIDGEYSDHRRPETVEFTSNLSEDLRRRDFTINAMAYNEKDGLIDLYDGIGDIERHVIRCVGNPDERFDEDALRIMRAVRFAAELDFEIDDATRVAAAAHAPELSAVSAERIETELTKLIMSDHPEKLMDAYHMGITKMILPEFDRMAETPQNTPYHCYDVAGHTIEVIRAIPKTKVLRYTALLHDSGKPDCRTTDESGRDHFKGHSAVSEQIAEQVLRRLKMDNDTIRDVKKLVYWHDYGMKGDVKITTFRKGLSKMGIEYFDRFVEIKKADIAGQSDYGRQESLDNLAALIAMRDKVVADGDCLSIKELAVNGGDLKNLGIKPGPEMGEILKTLLGEVLGRPSMNTKEILMKRASQLKK